MFAWFKALVARPSERRVVFRYFDGERRVTGDPLTILRNLEFHGGEHWMELVQAAGKRTQPNRFDVQPAGVAELERKRRDGALKGVAELAVKAFELKSLAKDGSGLTEAEQVGVLSRYLEFVGGLADEAAPLPVSSPPVLPFRRPATANSSA